MEILCSQQCFNANNIVNQLHCMVKPYLNEQLLLFCPVSLDTLKYLLQLQLNSSGEREWSILRRRRKKTKTKHNTVDMHSFYYLFLPHLFVLLEKHQIANSWITLFCELSDCWSNSPIKQTIFKLQVIKKNTFKWTSDIAGLLVHTLLYYWHILI